MNTITMYVVIIHCINDILQEFLLLVLLLMLILIQIIMLLFHY